MVRQNLVDLFLSIHGSTSYSSDVLNLLGIEVADRIFMWIDEGEDLSDACYHAWTSPARMHLPLVGYFDTGSSGTADQLSRLNDDNCMDVCRAYIADGGKYIDIERECRQQYDIESSSEGEESSSEGDDD